ncbi:hypothetical protein AK972_4777 [Pseudomonas yamanorum]|nr:hypothetical protein AK972_4777 [Pseudomonas yamanorum]
MHGSVLLKLHRFPCRNRFKCGSGLARECGLSVDTSRD